MGLFLENANEHVVRVMGEYVLIILGKNGQSSRPITIQNQTVDIRKIAENEFVEEDLELLKLKLLEGDEGGILHDRLSQLAVVLKRLGY